MTQKKKINISFWIPKLFGAAILILFTCTCERFDPESILVLRTESVEELPEGSYRLTARVINIGSEEILQHGFCWSTSENPTVHDQLTQLGPMNAEGTFTSTITDLSGDMRYHIRPYVTTSESTAYGKNKSFLTPPPNLPEVATAPVFAITGNSAECGGNVILDGAATVIARGVCWSTSENPTLADEHTTDGSGVGEFSSLITGLNCSKEYFVRAYATNSAGTAYGDQHVFATPECIPDEGIFIFSDRNGTWLMYQDGAKILFNSEGSRDIEIFESKIYIHWGHNVSVYDPFGSLIRGIAIDSRIAYPYKMCVLPGENMAFLDNERDTVSFTNSAGELVKTVSFTGQPPDDNLQSVNGVVAENSLIICEDGNTQLVRINLDNFEWSVFRNFQHLPGWLSDVDYADGTFYMTQSQKFFSFREDNGENLVVELPDYHNTGIAVLGNFAYITSNFGNKIYRVNVQNGHYEVILDDADRPGDIELIK